MTHDFKNLKDKLIKGKVIAVADELIEIAYNDLKDEKIAKELKVLQFRWEKVTSQERQNLLSYDKISTTKSQITSGVIDVMSIIKKRIETGDTGDVRKTKRNKLIYAIGGIALAFLLWFGYIWLIDPHHDDQHSSVYIDCPFHVDEHDTVVHYNILIVPFKNYSFNDSREKIDEALRDGLSNSTSKLNTLVRILNEQIDVPDYAFARSKLKECAANMLIWGAYEREDSINVLIKYVTDDLQKPLTGEGIQSMVGVVKSISSIESGELVAQFNNILGVTTPFLTGINMIKERKLDDAISQFDQIDSDNQQVQSMVAKAKGDVHLLQNDYDKAIDSYSEAIQSGEESAEPYNNIGYALYRKGDIPGAIENFKKAAQLNPDQGDILDNLNIAEQEFTNLQGSMAEDRSTPPQPAPSIVAESTEPETPAEVQPTMPSICNSASNCNKEGLKLYKAKKYDEAIKYYEAAIIYNSRVPEIYLNIGLVYNDKGDYDTAIVYYKRAESMDPEYPNTYYNMHIAYLNKGDRDNAQKYQDLFQSKGGKLAPPRTIND
ncbi:MAG: tetratricopeptide repeat protein [Saprospiraceae bacterium]|nr:tetratricopeptide repeat protein [Saprospiraceae bacterium]